MSNYRKDLLKSLRNRSYSDKYLSAAYADSTEAFLVALRDVATAQKSMTDLAASAEVNRENLYRMLSNDGNPRLHNLRAVLDALKLRIVIQSVADDRA
jgi:probable addiction module antidote protein